MPPRHSKLRGALGTAEPKGDFPGLACSRKGEVELRVGDAASAVLVPLQSHLGFVKCVGNTST